MPFIKLQLKPGINRDQTNYTNEGGWRDGNRIRFQSGLPQKLGGWVKATQTAFMGVCRQLHSWVTTFRETILAVGTHTNFYVYVQDVFFDLTPFTLVNSGAASGAVAPFGITNISAAADGDDVVITLTKTEHGLSAATEYLIQGVGAIRDEGEGGTVLSTQDLNGVFTITVVDVNTFSYVVPDRAPALTGVTLSYPNATIDEAYVNEAAGNILDPGTVSNVLAGGWGYDEWSFGPWGESNLDETAGVFTSRRDWFVAHFDNDLIANVREDQVYYWERVRTLPYDSGVVTTTDTSLGIALTYRMRPLTEIAKSYGYTSEANIASIPTKVHQIVVSQNDKHVIALGCDPLRVELDDVNPLDPLLIRWANQDEPWNWYPEITNSAGDIRVSRGSRIVQGLPTRQEILVFTDTTLYALQFTGTTDVFALQEYASNISIASPRAATTALDTVFWMGKNKFYMYSGRLQSMPCTVNDYVFDDINLGQLDAVVAGTNEDWDEIWWFYPSAASLENDRYVVYNYDENVWYYGDLGADVTTGSSISRNAWLDSGLSANPYATYTPDVEPYQGHLYLHEEGVDADGAAMDCFVESSDIDIGDGDKFALVRRAIPDIEFSGSNRGEEQNINPTVTFKVKPRNFPGEAVFNDPADSQSIISTEINRFTKQVYMRARARQMAIRLESNKLGTNWQMGTFRVDVREDGKR